MSRAIDDSNQKWHSWLSPILFAAEGKLQKRYGSHVHAQLAAAFQASMIILILYYLDTRASAHSAIPPWLFLYGIEYTENGLLIRAHAPYYEHNSQQPHWKFKSLLMATEYESVFVLGKPRSLRLKLLAALLKIRSHSWYVLDQLNAWKRGTRVLRPLEIHARKEETKE
jgi:hypothetical protein